MDSENCVEHIPCCIKVRIIANIANKQFFDYFDSIYFAVFFQDEIEKTKKITWEDNSSVQVSWNCCLLITNVSYYF